MNVNSRDWMWMVSGFTLLLLVGCSEEQKNSSAKTDAPKVSMSAPAEQKVAYAPEPAKKLEAKVKKEAEVALNTKTQTIPKGSFVEDEHLKPVYFDLHRSTLSNEALAIVQANAEWIKTQPPFLLEVVGVADQRGSASRNKTLAERRAQHVKDAYAALGILPERIQIVSLGENSQACSAVTEECFQISRRADTKIEEKALLAQR